MKRFFGLCAGLLMIGTLAYAEPHGTYYGNLWSENALAYNNTYIRDLNLSGEIADVYVIYSSATISSVTVDAPAFSLAGTAVSASNKFTTAIPVLYTSTVTIGGLTSGTTYYSTGSYPAGTSPSFQLSTTSTGAVAGSYITFSSTPSGSGYSITFAPLPITGTSGFSWQVSEDKVNWTNLNVSSVTFSSPYTASSSEWQLGTLYPRYLRLNAVAPTTGGVKFNVWFNQGTIYAGN